MKKPTAILTAHFPQPEDKGRDLDYVLDLTTQPTPYTTGTFQIATAEVNTIGNTIYSHRKLLNM